MFRVELAAAEGMPLYFQGENFVLGLWGVGAEGSGEGVAVGGLDEEFAAVGEGCGAGVFDRQPLGYRLIVGSPGAYAGDLVPGDGAGVPEAALSEAGVVDAPPYEEVAGDAVGGDEQLEDSEEQVGLANAVVGVFVEPHEAERYPGEGTG